MHAASYSSMDDYIMINCVRLKVNQMISITMQVIVMSSLDKLITLLHRHYFVYDN